MADVDPACCSHPQWDLALETREAAVRTGWVLDAPRPVHPELDAATFAWMKRAFYFEHEQGAAAIELADRDADRFLKLIMGDGDDQLREQLVSAINAAYCPDPFAGRGDHLYLWSGHRFHEQPSRSFVATDRVSVDDLQVLRPTLPARLNGAFIYEADHLVLTAPTRDDARLKIDFPLYRTLQRLRQGLPRKLMPERELHRLDAFLEKLGPSCAPDTNTIWSVHLENLQMIKIVLGAGGSRFESVQRGA